mmetsp:Transcript_2904/g.5310  ORF Transcript_2904/g.5310 Transcript_2904/m.5310 type:complete len:238 (-) Transcript_2904:495-1208(-)
MERLPLDPHQQRRSIGNPGNLRELRLQFTFTLNRETTLVASKQSVSIPMSRLVPTDNDSHRPPIRNGSIACMLNSTKMSAVNQTFPPISPKMRALRSRFRSSQKACALSSNVRSGSHTLNSPGSRSPKDTSPTRTLTKRSVGWPTAAVIFLTCRFFPSTSVIDSHEVGVSTMLPSSFFLMRECTGLLRGGNRGSTSGSRSTRHGCVMCTLPRPREMPTWPAARRCRVSVAMAPSTCT